MCKKTELNSAPQIKKTLLMWPVGFTSTSVRKNLGSSLIIKKKYKDFNFKKLSCYLSARERLANTMPV